MIKIATDVTADLPADQIAKYRINLVPAWVETAKGRVRTDALAVEEFAHLMFDHKQVRTMPLAVDEYDELFAALVGPGHSLVFVCTSPQISPVYGVVRAAAQRYPDHVTVVDSGGFSLWQGLLAISAGRLVANGCELSSLLATIEQIRAQSQFYFMIDSLSHMKKHGRLNAVQSLLGSMLDIKPVLTLQAGEIVLAESTMGRERALVKMQLGLLNALRDVPRVFLGVVHVGAEELAQRVETLMIETLRPSHSFITEAGPTVALHGGLGAVGIAVCPVLV